nr:uncharacterized protein LOC128691680 isoform X1 [Cherax quadricarinatus]
MNSMVYLILHKPICRQVCSQICEHVCFFHTPSLQSDNKKLVDSNHPDIRRQTLHCILKENRKISGLRMSSIPLETSCGINNLEVHPWEEVHNRSKSRLQITFNNEDDRNQANLIPSDPREHVLLLCEQEEPLPLTDCFTERCLCCCKKIGEGVYGEVFMTQPNPSSLEGAAVLKVMPIEGNFLM